MNINALDIGTLEVFEVNIKLTEMSELVVAGETEYRKASILRSI